MSQLYIYIYPHISSLLICKFNAIFLKIPARHFVDLDKIILKFQWKGKGTRVAKAILEKKKVGGTSLSNPKTWCGAAVIKAASESTMIID